MYNQKKTKGNSFLVRKIILIYCGQLIKMEGIFLIARAYPQRVRWGQSG